jgi:hypothetical protein
MEDLLLVIEKLAMIHPGQKNLKLFHLYPQTKQSDFFFPFYFNFYFFLHITKRFNSWKICLSLSSLP